MRDQFPVTTPLEPTMTPRQRPPGWTDIFLPAEERRLILREMGQLWGLHTFIETGTNLGDTPMFLKDDFTSLYTIELDQSLYLRARALLEPYSQILCAFGDSSEVLPKILRAINEPALVWLDGHHSGPGTARGVVDSPIRDELRILFEDGRPHVILVDDARCFTEGAEHDLEPHYADYPSISWVHELAEKNGYAFLLEDDIMFLTPQ